MAHILVADDDYAFRERFEAELSAARHVVSTADDGYQALEAASSAPLDLVFVSPNLAIFNGFEVCRMLRSDPEIPADMPVVLVCGRDIDPHDVESAGFTRTFAKSHAFGEVQELLADLLGPLAGPRD